MRALTERRKADREEMARRVIECALAHGASAEINPDHLGARAVWVTIRAPRGLCLTLDFDGDSSQPDMHVMSWHMATDVDTCLSDAFTAVGDINNYHYRKATTVAYGFNHLLNALSRGLALAATGAAFDDAREAAAIARAGETAAERCARYDAWRSAPKD